MAVISDIIETHAANETEGNLDYLVRRFIVTGLAYTGTAGLWDALNAIGVPRANEWAPGNTNLVCVGRKVEFLSNSNTKAQIDCEYRPIADSKTNFIFSGGTQLAQVTSQVDAYGNQIAVAHQWPSNDPDYPSQYHLQGLDMAVLMPQTTLVAVGQLPIAWPSAFAEFWVGSMNETYWSGADPYKWICSRVDFRGLDNGFGRQRRWEFTMEFQKNRNTWIPQTFFVDPRTGKPPSDLVPGEGIKNVDWYGVVDYNYLFPVT
jgi:hypothetical protein